MRHTLLRASLALAVALGAGCMDPDEDWSERMGEVEEGLVPTSDDALEVARTTRALGAGMWRVSLPASGRARARAELLVDGAPVAAGDLALVAAGDRLVGELEVVEDVPAGARIEVRLVGPEAAVAAVARDGRPGLLRAPSVAGEDLAAPQEAGNRPAPSGGSRELK